MRSSLLTTLVLLACTTDEQAPQFDAPSFEEVLGAHTAPPPELPGEAPHELALCQPSHMVPGTVATWSVSGAVPGETVHLGMGLRHKRSSICPEMLAGACIDLKTAWYLGFVKADGAGVATFDIDIPAHVSVGITTYAQAAVVGGTSQVTQASTVADYSDRAQCDSEDVCDVELCCESDEDGDGLCDTDDLCPVHSGELLDCTGACIDESWLGDGLCDDTLDCAEHRNDEGDCAPDCPDGDGDGLCDAEDRCPSHLGELVDCSGSCIDDVWLGDGFCDEDLDCPRYEFDGGDCAGVGAPTQPSAAIVPERPTPVDDLLCVVERESEDEDTEDLSYVVTWERDGAPFFGATTTTWPGDTVPYDHTAPHSEFICSLVATDGTHDSEPGLAAATISVPWAVQVDAAHEHSCMVDEARRAQCWGRDVGGKVSGYEPMLEYVAVEVNDHFSCGLLYGGGMHCWGTVPGNTPVDPDFVALSGYHSAMCGLDIDGEVTCWGSGDATVGIPAGPFTQIDLGTGFACALRDDQTLDCWGSDVSGRTRPPLGKYTDVTTGHVHACAVSVAGLVSCWGGDIYGQSDTAHLSGTFESVAGSHEHTCAIRAGGEATCWGNHDRGALNAPAGVHFERLSGGFHTCGVTDAGVVRCWGESAFGEAPDVGYDPALE